MEKIPLSKIYMEPRKYPDYNTNGDFLQMDLLKINAKPYSFFYSAVF